MRSTLLGIALLFTAQYVAAQDTMTYVGKTLSNVDYHHGQLKPVVGTHNIQTFRANRAFPERAGGLNFTYNHQPFLAYWNDTYYLQFLSNPVGEHIAEGITSLQTSKDGYTWSDPVELFPPYLVPEGFTKPGRSDKAGKDLYAIMHQRMGFYTAKNGKLLTIGYYGVALDAKDSPNDGYGVGRVVREIKKDGSFGPIYFIRFNSSFDQKKAKYPLYTKSKDKAFVEACNELMKQPLQMMQWVEEADRNDPLIPYNRPLKAFAYYTLNNGNVVGMWKHALTSVSKDQGKTWAYEPLRAPGFVNSNAKIWGQRTADNRFATVYNPSEFRWPLAVSTSDDGLTYTDLLLIHGEITTMRYGGNYKSYGPQYPRGIQEGNGVTPDKNIWVTYSVNKEDMWVSKVPVPVTGTVEGNVNDDFAQNGLEVFQHWNIYSPLWAPVKLDNNALLLKDKDPFDHAKAERVIPSSTRVKVAFTVTPKQTDHGRLEIELVNDLGQAAARLVFDEKGQISNKAGYRMAGVQGYEAGKTYNIVLTADVRTRSYTIQINGTDKGTRLFFQPVHEISRVTFRTGETRRYPDADTPTDQHFDVKDADGIGEEAAYAISTFQAEKLN